MDKILFRQIEQSEVRADKEKPRMVTFVASDESRDSAGTVISVDGWDLTRFNKNGIIGYQHKVYGGWDDTANPDNVIGKGHAYIKGKKLMVDVEFEPAEINPLAEKIYQKILFGSLKAVSVGFMVIEGDHHWGEGEEAMDGARPTYYYNGQELLEVSVVNIPANPNALKKNFIEQSIEDEMKGLRAGVEPEVPADPDPKEDGPDDEKQRELAAAQVEFTLTRARVALL